MINQLFEDKAPELVPEEPESPFRLAWIFIRDVLETVFLSVALFLVINTITARVRVDGFSMEPSLHNGEFVIVNRMAYRFSEMQRGDIVVFHYPKNPAKDYIKRIIGLPGDEVEVRDRVVSVNGIALEENYIADEPLYNGKWMVPEGSLFVLGDNRNNSSDSHSWGFLGMDYMVGKATFVYWPISNIGLIDHPAIAIAAP